MIKPRLSEGSGAGNGEFIGQLLRDLIEREQIDVPVLPEIAARVVTLAASDEADTRRLTRLIVADQALASNVMRVATTAAYQPTQPLNSLSQAITWLGMNAVADIAFTVAVQGRILSGPRHKAQLLAMWREAVAAGVWAREIAGMAGRQTDAAYLQGLLHQIGKPVVMQAIVDLSERAAVCLDNETFASLVTQFQAEVGERVVSAWQLPPAIAAVIRCWRSHDQAGEYVLEAAVVGLAHRFADFALSDDSDAARESMCQDERVALIGLDAADLVNLFNRTERVLAQVRTY